MLFFVLGVSGWLCSYASLRLDTKTYAFMKYADTVGSSPATYGLTLLAALKLPLHRLQSPFQDYYFDVVVGTSSSSASSPPPPMVVFPAWLLLGWMLLLPLVKKPTSLSGLVITSSQADDDARPLWRKVAMQTGNAVLVCLLCWGVVRPACTLAFGDSANIPLWAWLAVYMLQSSIYRLMQRHGHNQVSQSGRQRDSE